jgi:type VII secretion protein EccE
MGDRLGAQFGAPTAQFLSAAGTAAALGAAAAGLDQPHVWAAGGVVLPAVSVLTYRGRSALGWARRGIGYRRSDRTTATVYPTDDGAGVVWDGRRASVWIELLPRPYEVTLLGSDDDTLERHLLPIDDFRDELVQYDIRCDSITVVTVGHKYGRQSQLAELCQKGTGPVPALLYGRTVVEVAVGMDDRSLDSINIRGGKDGVLPGLISMMAVAAVRVRNRAVRAGWRAELMTADDVRDLDDEIGGVLRPALTEEHWGSCGPKTMRTLVYTPAGGAWDDEHYRDWCRINTSKQLQIARLYRRRRRGDHAEMFMAYVTSDPAALGTARAVGLLRECGQQGDILTGALPLTRTVRPSAIRGRSLGVDPFPIGLHAGGVGTFIGRTANKSRVFVNFGASDGEPFYVVGPPALFQQLLLRLAETSGRTVDVGVAGDGWAQFAAAIGVGYRDGAEAGIVATTEEGLVQAAHPEQVRLVWATKQPAAGVRYAIVAGPGVGKCVLYTPGDAIGYEWTVSPGESSYLTDVGAAARV